MPTVIEEKDVALKLEKLGFVKAAASLKIMAEKKRKLAIAYEHYRFVRKEKVEAFNKKLRAETMQGKEPYNASWKYLKFTLIQDYDKVPPEEILALLEVAQGRQCFDGYSVAHIAEVKDPILFGFIKECTDWFFIGQWDTDVKIEDILMPNEG